MSTRGKFRVPVTLLVSLLACLCFNISAVAASANISHSYHATSTLTNGDIVSLDPQKANYVQASNSSNAARLVGVVTAASDSLLAASDGSAGTSQIATSGNVNTLVSTLGGNISVGDMVAVSPFDGIGMKASSGMHVIGLAQTAFTDSSAGATQQQVTDKNGKTHQITIGYVPISIAISVDGNGASSDAQLNSLQKVAKNFTGRTIPTARVVIAFIVAIVSVGTLMALVYSAVYGGIISIGRNPLAKNSIFVSLASVIEMIIVLAAVTVAVIFFLLR